MESTSKAFTENPFDEFRKRLNIAIFESSAEIPEPPKSQKKSCRSQRAELFKELYGYYEQCYRKTMWHDYIKWLARNRYRHSKEKVSMFKQTKDYRPKINIKSFCSYWLGFVSTDDLFYLNSIARDKTNRGENFNKWLFWAIKKQ